MYGLYVAFLATFASCNEINTAITEISVNKAIIH